MYDTYSGIPRPRAYGKRISIVGAGITGPSAALALARAGHDVTVYDKRPASALRSTGILGITPPNCRMLEKSGVDLSVAQRGHVFRDYTWNAKTRSPFTLFAWTDLHEAITRAAIKAGAVFRYETPVQLDWHSPKHVNRADITIDAGGVASAAHLLKARFIHQFLYRGISPVTVREAFGTFKIRDRSIFFDVGHVNEGTAWVLGVPRPMPAHLGTTYTEQVPAEVELLPPLFRRIVRETHPIQVLPQSVWDVAASLHNDPWTHLTLGDTNGPPRPLTTSGANHGIADGMAAPTLVARHDETLAQSLLEGRRYANVVGAPSGGLLGPQIGGYLEDPLFHTHQWDFYPLDGGATQ